MIELHSGFFQYVQLHWRQHQDQKVAALHMTSRKSSCTDLQSPSAFQAMQYGSRTTAVSVTNENFYFKHQLSIYCIRQHKTSVFLRNLILSIMVTQGHDSCSQKVYKTVLPSLDDPDKLIMT